jgi:hypothetical protein
MKVVDVNSRSTLKQFLSIPEAVYSAESPYIRPLNLHVKMMLGKLPRPKTYAAFVLNDQGQPIARMAAKVHTHAHKTSLNFGFFECVEGYPLAAQLLVKHLSQFHPDLKMMGPFHFRMEDPYVGILTDGFDRDPYFLMSYNPPYYADYLQKAGMTKAMDLFTYKAHSSDIELMPVVRENAEKARLAGVTARTLDMKNLETEARLIARIFNDALSKNWGFEEFLDEQVKEMVTLFKLFIDPRVVAFAEYQGKTVGCLMMLPNYNPIIAKAHKGRLTPSLVMEYFTKRKKLSSIRGYALGVLREAHGLGIGSFLTEFMFRHGGGLGYHDCEISWVLASNGPMNELSKAMNGKQNKVYTIFERAAPATAPIES